MGVSCCWRDEESCPCFSSLFVCNFALETSLIRLWFVFRRRRRRGGPAPVCFDFSPFPLSFSRRGRIFIFSSIALSFSLFSCFSCLKNHAPRGLPAPRCLSSSSSRALVGSRFVLEQDRRRRRVRSSKPIVLFLFVFGGDGRFRSLHFVVFSRRRRALLQAAPARRAGQPRADNEPGRVDRAECGARG